MTALPLSSDFTGPVSEGDFKTAITGMRDFLAGLLGTDGTDPTALASLGALASAYLGKVAAYTVVLGDRGKVIEATTGTWTLGLPTAATAGAGFSFILRNSGTGVITVDPAGTEQVDGATTLSVAGGRAVLLMCTGTAWVSNGMVSAAFTSTAAGLVPASGGGTLNFLRADGTFAPAVVADGDKGDLTVSSSGTVWTIDNAVVTLPKMANLPASTILGNNTGLAATPIALTPAQVKTQLAIAAGDVSGLGALATAGSASLTTQVTGILPAANGGTGQSTLPPALSGLFSDGTLAAPGISFVSDTDTGIRRVSTNSLAIVTAGADAVTIDASGFVNIGSPNVMTGIGAARINSQGAGSFGATWNIIRHSANTFAPTIAFGKTRSTVVDGYTIVNSGDTLGIAEFWGADGLTMIRGGYIQGYALGTPVAGDVRAGFRIATGSGLGATTVRLTVDDTNLTSTLPFLGPDGTAGAPAFGFSSGANTGLFRQAAGVISTSSAGTEAIRMSAASLAILNAAGDLRIGGVATTNKVLGPRITGWANWTGTATRTAIVTSTATLANVAEAVKALIDDLKTHGLIGT